MQEVQDLERRETRTLSVEGGKPRPQRRGPTARLDVREKKRGGNVA